MATYEEAITALRNAHDAGDVEAATRLAQIAVSLKKTPDKSLFEKAQEGAVSGFKLAGPLGALAGASGPLTDHLAYKAGQVATDAATALKASPEVAAGVGTAANVATQMLPMAAGGAIGSAARPVVGWASRKLMNSALKPAIKAHQTGGAERGVQTMLDEGLNVSRTSLNALQRRMDNVDDVITHAIGSSNATINKNAVASRLLDNERRALQQATPQDDLRAIENAWTNFLTHPGAPGPSMPVQQAQTMKRGTMRSVREKYGQLGAADVEAQKGLARGLREEISAAVPEVAPLNARLGNLASAENLLERRVMMGSNNNPLGLAPLAPNSWRSLLFLLDRSPYAQSALANNLYRTPRALGMLSGAAAGAGSGLPPDVLMGLLSNAQ